MENTPQDDSGLVKELNDVALRLEAVKRLQHYGMAPDILENPDALGSHFFLLQLDTEKGQLNVRGYKNNQLPVASADYLAAEKAIGGSLSKDAVLVSVDSLAALRRAYPNYFLDTKLFLQLVNNSLASRFDG